jgi:hypothetical protein
LKSEVTGKLKCRKKRKTGFRLNCLPEKFLELADYPAFDCAREFA